MAYNLIPKRLFYNPIINILRIRQAPYSEEAKVPKNLLAGQISADLQQEDGIVYDKKPIKIALDAGKKYLWCLCGRSKNQPMCDGSHKQQELKIKLRPIKFEVEESKEYWLCNCKHTDNRPFCDSTHKSKLIQESTSTVRS